MALPVILDLAENVMMEIQIGEILKINEESRKHGLVLNAEEAKEIIESRNFVLQSYGRVELDTRVMKEIINRFCNSPFINQCDYLSTLNELQEIFYYMKNETGDSMGDDELIALIRDFFDNCCGGSTELLKGMLETFSAIFRCKNMKMDYVERDGDN